MNLLRKIGITIVGLMVAVGSIVWVRWVIEQDAFSAYAARAGVLGGDITIRMTNVSLKHFSGATKISDCVVVRLDSTNNQQVLELHDVRNGSYQSDKGEFQYDAASATYDRPARTLTVRAGARIHNKDMDLKAPEFTYLEESKQLKASGAIVGRFFGGQLAASSLTYEVGVGNYHLGPIVWEGEMASPLQEATGETQKSRWKIKSQSMDHKDGHDYFENAEATDGDVIVSAPKIERDVKTDSITATGRVRYFSVKANLICDKCVVYRKEKRAVLTGNVQMLVKAQDQEKLEVQEIPPFRPMVPDEISEVRPPAPPVEDKGADQEVRSAETRRKYPIAVLAAKIEYWYKKGNRKAVITGSPQARQDLSAGRWRAIWTTTAYYDGEAESLKLESPKGKQSTRLKTSLGDDILCGSAWISTKEKDDAYKLYDLAGSFNPDEDIVPPTTTTGGGGGGLKGRIGG